MISSSYFLWEDSCFSFWILLRCWRTRHPCRSVAGNTGGASIVFQFQPKYNQRLITKKELTSKSPFFTPRVVISLAFCAIGVLVALLAFSLYSGGYAFAQVPLQDQSSIPDFVE